MKSFSFGFALLALIFILILPHIKEVHRQVSLREKIVYLENEQVRLKIKEDKRFCELQCEMERINWDERQMTVLSRSLILCILKIRRDLENIELDIETLRQIDHEKRAVRRYIEDDVSFFEELKAEKSNSVLSDKELSVLQEARERHK